MKRTITVFDPTVKGKIKIINVSAPTHDLNGKVVGFIWNHKPNGDILLNRIKEELSRRFNLKGTIWKHWEGEGTDSEISLLEEMGTTADVIVVAIGD